MAGEEKTEVPKKDRKIKRPKADPGKSLIQRMDDGRYFCGTCMETFDVADDQEPTECPQGHRPGQPEAASL